MEPEQVISGVMHFLNLRIPPYVRIDFVQISFSHALKSKYPHLISTLFLFSLSLLFPLPSIVLISSQRKFVLL